MASFKQILHSTIAFSRPKTPIYIIEAYIWYVITSIHNAWIILTWPVAPATNASFLQFCSSKIKFISAGNSIRLKLNATIPFFLLKTNLKPFFWQNFRK